MVEEKIKHYRNKSNLSQESLAELVGVSRQAVTRWEAGQSMPSMENMIKLSEIFAVSMDEFTGNFKDQNHVENEQQTEFEAEKPIKKKRIAKTFFIIWGSLLLVLLVASIFAIRYGFQNPGKETLGAWLFTVFNLMLILLMVIIGGYVIYLLIRYLKKNG